MTDDKFILRKASAGDIPDAWQIMLQAKAQMYR